MKNQLWSILIATLGQRGDRLYRLLDGLLPQVERHAGAVRVLALWNNGERPLSHVRQDLVVGATGEYVSFVDDDDELPAYFVDEVVANLGDVDYVGWRMQCVLNGVKLKPTYHSLRYDGWSEDPAGYYRDVSHLNPVRRELALRADFRRGDPPEDVSWAKQLSGVPRTENFIEKIMYTYHANTDDSTWRGEGLSVTNHVRPVVDSAYFDYHPGSSACTSS